MDNRPIGIFDSGYGGLTVLNEVRSILPNESLLYFGDSANAPYSQYSAKECVEKAHLAAGVLRERGAKALIVACNLLSGVALPELKKSFTCPVIGVIEAGAQEVGRLFAGQSARVGIIGGPTLMDSGVYEKAVKAACPDAAIRSVGTGKLVRIVESGELDSPETDAVVAEYMREFDGFAPDALILGCTHYPLLAPSIRKALGNGTVLVNPARNTALHGKRLLEEQGLLSAPHNQPTIQYYTSGDPAVFRRFIEAVFDIDGPDVAHLDLV